MRDHIRPALDAARSMGMPIVYVENHWEPGVWSQSEFGRLNERTECGDVGAFEEAYIGTDYNAYSEVVAPGLSDFRVEKTMYDGFFGTTLDTVLGNLNAKHLVCVGFSAEIAFSRPSSARCIGTTA